MNVFSLSFVLSPSLFLLELLYAMQAYRLAKRRERNSFVHHQHHHHYYYYYLNVSTIRALLYYVHKVTCAFVCTMHYIDLYTFSCCYFLGWREREKKTSYYIFYSRNHFPLRMLIPSLVCSFALVFVAKNIFIHNIPLLYINFKWLCTTRNMYCMVYKLHNAVRWQATICDWINALDE